MRATALDAAERPSAREMHDVIERVLDGARHDETSRALSAAHASRARAEMTRVESDPLRARERAAHELHRAIALDASNAEALDLLLHLANERPPEDEASVGEKVDAFASRANRLVARWLAALFLSWVASVSLVLATHARDRSLLGLLLGAIVMTTALAACRAYSTNRWLVYAALSTGLGACALTGFIFSPFILVPTLLSITGVIFGLTASPNGKVGVRHYALVGAVLAFAVPLLLEYVGLLAPSYEFREGGLLLFARAADFMPAAETIRYLIGFNLVLIVVPGLVVERVRRHEISVEKRAFRATERMKRLLPKAVHVADLAVGEGETMQDP